MTKREIVRRVSEDLGVTKTLAREVAQRILDSMAEALSAEGRIELRNFGIFNADFRGPTLLFQ